MIYNLNFALDAPTYICIKKFLYLSGNFSLKSSNFGTTKKIISLSSPLNDGIVLNTEIQLGLNFLFILSISDKVKPWGFKVEANNELKFTKGFHASGHLSISDLEFVISEIDPKWIIPVHTENPDWFRNHKDFGDKVVKLSHGEKFEIT